jgi:tRNA(Ile)-lysidine synthase
MHLRQSDNSAVWNSNTITPPLQSSSVVACFINPTYDARVTDLVNWAEKSILARRLFHRGEAVLAAVSGGLDSMVLLHVLERLARVHGWQIHVAHFNHQLRGRSSDADQRLVQRTAAQLSLPFIAGRADVRGYSRSHNVSLEMAARKLRHDFLARAARQQKIRSIALAHHADDQVELFFLRLLRGAGGEGLAGMKWQGPSPSDSKITLARPLLGQSKAALHNYAKVERIRFREDATNAQLDIFRNRIRHELLPLLAKNYQPALTRVILRQMEIIGAESAFVNEAAVDWLRLKRRPEFETLPLAVQRRCLQIQLLHQGITVNFELVERIRETADYRVAVNDGLSVCRDVNGNVQFRSPEQSGFRDTQIEVDLSGREGEIVFENTRITWESKRANSGIFRASQRVANCEFFDAEKVGSSVILRHWRPGDRFQPLGMAFSVKLQDLFTNQKVLRAKRHQLILGESTAGELFWVEDMRLAERFKLDKSTIRLLKWRWQRVC